MLVRLGRSRMALVTQPNREVTAHDSRTITRVLRKPLIKGYKQLVKHYGIFCDIYRLVTPNNPAQKAYGFDDDFQNYERQPYYTGLVLIPSMFRRRNSVTLAMLDPFVDSDQYLYIPADIDLDVNSLVVCKLSSGKILNYRISEITSVGNEAGEVVRRYNIVPVLSTDPLRNTNEIKKALEAEMKAFKENKLHNGSTTEPNYDAKGNMQYEPLE